MSLHLDAYPSASPISETSNFLLFDENSRDTRYEIFARDNLRNRIVGVRPAPFDVRFLSTGARRTCTYNVADGPRKRLLFPISVKKHTNGMRNEQTECVCVCVREREGKKKRTKRRNNKRSLPHDPMGSARYAHLAPTRM